jgi:hypothetical protein
MFSITALKLSSDGVYQWHTFYGTEHPDRIIVDASGNVYVTGYSNDAWTGPTGQSPLHEFSGTGDIFALKLSSAGAYAWHTFYGGLSSNRGYSIALNASGDLLISAHSDNSWDGPDGQSPVHAFSGGSPDLVVLKLSSAGGYQWHTFYGGMNGDIGRGIGLDATGNIYVAGESMYSWDGPDGQKPLHSHSGDREILVIKLTDPR